jgi:hypothetical protein
MPTWNNKFEKTPGLDVKKAVGAPENRVEVRDKAVHANRGIVNSHCKLL